MILIFNPDSFPAELTEHKEERVPPVGEANVVGGHRPADAVGAAAHTHRQTAPEAGIVEAGIVIGHGHQGDALGPLGNHVDQTLLVVDAGFVQEHCGSRDQHLHNCSGGTN